eukprot:3218626-Rhodomonas_salina.1
MQVRLPYAFAEFQDDDDKRLKFATSVANTSGVGVDQVDWPFYADPTLVSATLADVEITTASQVRRQGAHSHAVMSRFTV